MRAEALGFIVDANNLCGGVMEIFHQLLRDIELANESS